eukprot:gnl/TRDRNA2_/TRDRNA2_189209_c0_seq1.p1 gnl/TRDRNA2_/TRDRNA2_189209_c0~~gnl/TRDRNA2_/TRDRNA2_189209_c0_seq1.p1  ORF type:complete len:147 (+),score=11.67 gnl/TRDRNA2_/TRDRNA2_189209_c0_seq1:67-441(+)
MPAAAEARDEEDLIPDNLFIKFVHCVAWLLTLLLSIVSVAFMMYQLFALYLPYCFAKITGNTAYRFPEYFYKVWGDDATDLTSEHWGYLGACAVVTYLSLCHVVPYHPFSKASRGTSTSHAKAE